MLKKLNFLFSGRLVLNVYKSDPELDSIRSFHSEICLKDKAVELAGVSATLKTLFGWDRSP